MSTAAPLDIRHDAGARQFVCMVEGHRCVIDYTLANAIMTIIHSSVPEAVGGRGIAAELTRVAFATAREHGWKVRPVCSYAEAYTRRHPEVADLLA